MTQPYPGGATNQRPHGQSRGTARRWVLPGLTAGGFFLVVEMLFGSFTTTVWAFPEGIAHTIGIGAHGYGLQPLPLLAGVIVHLSVSVGLGALFTVLADRLRLAGTATIIAAWLFSGAETAVAIWAVLHTVLPATLPMLLQSVPLWASIVGHNIYGLTLGFLLSTHDRATSPHASLRARSGQP
ncbi:MAG TPA: hypothetical protein VGL06_31095 [Pseudonocardiaceae bacterium]